MNGISEQLTRLIPLLIPILIIQLGLAIYCLFDLYRRVQTNGPKWLWAVIILIGQLWGPILYLIIGRKE